MIEVAKPVELLNILSIFQRVPFQNSFHFCGFHSKSSFTNNMTQDWDLFDFPIALGLLNVEVVFR